MLLGVVVAVVVGGGNGVVVVVLVSTGFGGGAENGESSINSMNPKTNSATIAATHSLRRELSSPGRAPTPV